MARTKAKNPRALPLVVCRPLSIDETPPHVQIIPHVNCADCHPEIPSNSLYTIAPPITDARVNVA